MATVTSPGRAGSASLALPNASVAASSVPASAAPARAPRHGSTRQPATAVFTATRTNDTAWTPPSSAIWMTGNLRYCE